MVPTTSDLGADQIFAHGRRFMRDVKSLKPFCPSILSVCKLNPWKESMYKRIKIAHAQAKKGMSWAWAAIWKTLPLSILYNLQRLPAQIQSPRHQWTCQPPRSTVDPKPMTPLGISLQVYECYKSWFAQGLGLTLGGPRLVPWHPVMQKGKHCLQSLKHTEWKVGNRTALWIYQPNKYK